MKLRIGGVCASLILLVGCQGGDTGSQAAASAHIDNRPLAAAVDASLSLQRQGASVANAPDRGALVSYKNDGKPAKREGAYTWYPIAISEAHALKAVVGGEMIVPAPDGSQVKLRYERHEEHPDGNWTWVGRVEGGDPNQEAILTFGEKAVYGSIPQASGPALNLETRGGVLWAVQTDPSKVRNPNTAETDIMLPPARALRESVAAQASNAAMASGAVMQSAVMAAAAPHGGNTIDLAIGYTPAFAAAQGGASAAVTRLTFLVQVGNQAFGNSQIDGYLRLVKAVEVNYADNTKNTDALAQLTGHNGTSAVAVPASLVPLRTARDESGADVAVLVRKFNTPENDGCGVAWLNGADQTAINPATDAAFGYAVVSDGTDQGTDGNNYFCAPETLVHEVGHVMGSAHDRDNAKKSNGDLQYGRYAYSFGMKTDSANGNFYTVMAYGSNGQTGYRVFSNPNITFCGGRACGVANQTDNARSLNQTIPVVAQFRATVVPFINNLRNDYDGDGKSDVFWRNSANGQNIIWKAANHNLSGYAATVADQQWKAVASGDFNGDGKSDIFWRNSATGQNILWPSGSAAELQWLLSVTDLNWRIAGVGDFNGDGKADIFWQHATSGQNLIWWAGNALQQSAGATVSTAWRVVGTGDFTGDGKDDLFWRNSSTGENIIWQSGVSTNYLVQTTIPNQAWQVAATGDFNGDGKADVFWSNSATGETVTWHSGSHAGSSADLRVSAGWRVVAAGDYNGDARFDLFWFNQTTGQSIIWWSGKSANSTLNIAVLGNWSPVL